MEKKYKTLLNRYPNYISLDELYKICKISKKSARYLVEHGIVPAIDTGKKTWRYKIDINNVITYLRKRVKIGNMIPPGAVTNRQKNKSHESDTFFGRKSYAQMVIPGREHEMAEYFNYIYCDCDEVLTTSKIADMTGLCRRTILQLAKNGKIKSIEQSPKYLIPKKYLIEFVVTRRFIEANSKSSLFNKLLGGFEIWKNAKLSQ